MTGRKIEIVKINTGVLRINVKLMWQVYRFFFATSPTSKENSNVAVSRKCVMYTVFFAYVWPVLHAFLPNSIGSEFFRYILIATSANEN